jgi:hypothetical protein
VIVWTGVTVGDRAFTTPEHIALVDPDTAAHPLGDVFVGLALMTTPIQGLPQRYIQLQYGALLMPSSDFVPVAGWRKRDIKSGRPTATGPCITI